MSSFDPLPPLGAPCVKCDSTDFELTWIPAAGDPGFERSEPLIYVEPREHMSVVCMACGFVWPAEPLDAKEGP